MENDKYDNNGLIDNLSTEQIEAMSEDTIDNKFLLFKIAEEEFGIEISCVKEIINIVPITQVPHTPNYLKGIINLRGDIVPIIEIRTRFRMAHMDYDDLTCIIVIENEGEKIGFIVDAVNEVKYIRKDKISSPPSVKLAYSNQFVRNLGSVDDKVVLLLDRDKILSDD